MKIYFNNTTRTPKIDKNKNVFVNYNNQKYILTSIKNYSTILKNEKYENDTILATLIAENVKLTKQEQKILNLSQDMGAWFDNFLGIGNEQNLQEYNKIMLKLGKFEQIV